jgi:hypothetical protein
MLRDKVRIILGSIFLSCMFANSALADVAVAVRGGTFGFGVDFNIGLTKTLNARLGYNTFSLSQTTDETDVIYDGKLKIGTASAILDWHTFNGGFRLSAGLVQKGPTIDVVGKPGAGSTYEINDRTYTAAQIGSLKGTIKLGGSTSPYLGVGWGNTLDEGGRVTFLFDIGAIITSAKTELTVTCGAAATTATCNQINNDVNAEKAELDDAVTGANLWPVFSLGLGVRF